MIINLLLRGQEAKIGKYEKDDEFFEYCAIWKIFRLQYRCEWVRNILLVSDRNDTGKLHSLP